MAFCTLAQWEMALGGADVALQLSGSQDYGDTAYTTFASECREDGSAELAGELGVQYATATLDSTDRNLANHAASLAAWWAWSKGSRGQAVPDKIQMGREAAILWAQRAASRRSVVNQSTAGKVQPVKRIDPDPDGTGISPLGFRQSGFR